MHALALYFGFLKGEGVEICLAGYELLRILCHQWTVSSAEMSQSMCSSFIRALMVSREDENVALRRDIANFLFSQHSPLLHLLENSFLSTDRVWGSREKISLLVTLLHSLFEGNIPVKKYSSLGIDRFRGLVEADAKQAVSYQRQALFLVRMEYIDTLTFKPYNEIKDI